jgi:hypothetical protein
LGLSSGLHGSSGQNGFERLHRVSTYKTPHPQG